MSQLRARDDLHWRLVDDEVVILDLRTSRYLSLNRTGAELWMLLVEGSSRTRLVDALSDGHRIDRADAGRDVDRLLGQLAEAGLVEEATATGGPATPPVA